MERTHLLALLFHCDAYMVYKYTTTASTAYHRVAKTAPWTGGCREEEEEEEEGRKMQGREKNYIK